MFIKGINVELDGLAITVDNRAALEFKDNLGNAHNLFISPADATNLLLLLISYTKSEDFKALVEKESDELHGRRH